MYPWVDTFLETFSFVGAVAIALLVSQAAQRYIVIRARLNAGAAPAKPGSVMRKTEIRSGLLNWIQTHTSLSRPQERAKLAADLARAGFESPSAPAIYVATRFGLALVLPAMLIIGRTLAHRPSGGLVSSLLPLVLSLAALMLPSILLKRRIAARRTDLEQQFPDALDLMVVCMDAGLGLEAAVQRVGDDMQQSHPRIAQELKRVSDELAAGRSRADALHHLAERAETPLIRGFVSLLIQSQALGASIAQGLRTYAVEMRATRAHRAEEKAMRIPVLISIPMVTCFLPVIIVALLLPSIIDMHRTLMPMLAGGHR